MLPATPQAITQPTDRAASGLPRTLAAKAGAHRAPANANTTSDGIGMHMQPSIISTKTATYPLSAISRWTVSVKTASRGNTFRLRVRDASKRTNRSERARRGGSPVFRGLGGTVRPRGVDLTDAAALA